MSTQDCAILHDKGIFVKLLLLIPAKARSFLTYNKCVSIFILCITAGKLR